VLLYPDGSTRDVIMGSDPLHGQAVQFVVPAGVWQAGEMVDGGRYSLFGCTMAPGFTGDIFEGGVREQLVRLYPERAVDIEQLTSGTGETQMPKGFAS
jgi:predicted cupin superfamily sugar epimerase